MRSSRSTPRPVPRSRSPSLARRPRTRPASCSASDTAIGSWGNIRTAFEGACREAKIPDFRFHDLRHTCASWLVMKGRSLKEVQELLELLGHREFSMTLRYAHLSPDRLRDAVASLEGFSTKSAQRGKINEECLVS